MSSQAITDLWEFASDFYKDDAIKDRCLDLQKHDGASVDLVLWLCWLYSHGIYLEKAALTQGLNIVGGVNEELLLGLRELRSDLMASNSFTRVQEQLIKKYIVNAELAIEKVLLQRLQDVTARFPKIDASDDYLSLHDYFSQLNLTNPDDAASFFLDKIVERDLEELEEISA